MKLGFIRNNTPKQDPEPAGGWKLAGAPDHIWGCGNLDTYLQNTKIGIIRQIQTQDH